MEHLVWFMSVDNAIVLSDHNAHSRSVQYKDRCNVKDSISYLAKRPFT